ncbi:hypothetical protein BIV57_00145 [Mangrovactinospora gilvigrisea]|uniref:Uncharacterized protein n=1 Tax=Mangrovactinospora gilvigrisea TaxID=1428644 RepID=A0A1J7CCN3_9ACTN|nr:hypothetical protein [Mangrovactinospora gilvigrisea]OIV39300.1 hypothetical protein BIV57_00145 [Mangrovactinospora gilvigrisea]
MIPALAASGAALLLAFLLLGRAANRRIGTGRWPWQAARGIQAIDLAAALLFAAAGIDGLAHHHRPDLGFLALAALTAWLADRYGRSAREAIALAQLRAHMHRHTHRGDWRH